MGTETRDTKSYGQHVGSEPQWALDQHIILNAKAPNLIHDKMEYWVSPHCQPSDEGLRVYSEECGRMQQLQCLQSWTAVH
jgi:hypothetical protein